MKFELGTGTIAFATTALATGGDWGDWLDRFGWPGFILIGLFFLALRLGRWAAPRIDEEIKSRADQRKAQFAEQSEMNGRITKLQHRILLACEDNARSNNEMVKLHVDKESTFSTIGTNRALIHVCRAIQKIADSTDADVAAEIVEAERYLTGYDPDAEG